jgi:alanyl-tRNA synthetase
MTKRLYYLDSYIKEFFGHMLQRRTIDGKPAVILNQTAFYPASGGQPHDTGILGNARVVNVLEDTDGEVIHVLEREIPADQISGRIDWNRRFDHMQQHTGQHILSQAFIAVAQARTLSFHMGSETSTIDVELAQPSPSQMEEAQTLASKIVFENRAVHILATDRENLSSLGVRKESQREGEIRVIDVEGFDRSACGGTHVRYTGEIGLIVILGFERYKGGTRVEFAAGYRALKAFSADHELLKRLGKLYSASLDKIPAMTEKLLQEKADLFKEKGRLQSQLLEMEAGELLRNARISGRAAVVSRIYTGRSLEDVKALAQKLTAQPGALAIFAIADAGQLVVARSADLPGSCHEAIRHVAAEFGGKGGGKPDLAQAGGFPAGSLDSCLAALEKHFFVN